MYSFRLAVLCMVSLCTLALPAFSADRVFLLPSTSNNVVTVLDAGTLASVGSVETPSTAFDVERSLDGRFYYIISRRGEDTITIVNSATLEVVDTIDLGISPSSAEVTPDGRYLLLTAGQLFVIDLETNTEATSLAVGSQPTRLIVDDTSTSAYVLANSGALISIVDLDTLKVRDSIKTRGITDIAFSEAGDRLLAVRNEGVQIYRTGDLALADTVPGKAALVNATLFPVPGGTRVIVQTSGANPNNTSQLIDFDSGEARNIGPIGQAEFADVAVVDDKHAYAVIKDTGEIVDFDISSLEQDIEIHAIGLANHYRDLQLSPGGGDLFASSLVDSNVVKINTDNNSVEQTVTAPLAPSGHVVVFAPSELPPADMKAIGGQGQYFPPGSTLPTRLSIRVTDRNGLPVAGVPVLFNDESDLGFTFSPEQTSTTNGRGVASVQVAIPPDPTPPVGQEPEQPPDPVTAYQVSAAAGGLNPVGFQINVIRGVGPIVISGNNQLTSQLTPFPLPMVLLVTDANGKPVPAGTRVEIAATYAQCTQSPAFVDQGGFLTITCRGQQLPGNLVYAEGSVIASVPDLLGQGIPFSGSFQVSVGLTAVGISVEKISGDNQTGEAGSKLPNPLQFRVVAPFGGTGPFGTEITQVSGPPVKLNPSRFVDLPGRTKQVEVTLGESAGKTVLKVTALAPGLPSTTFTVNATGGRPTSIQSSGGGQSGRILTTLPTPLRVQVINEAGSPVPFPDVQWTVLGGGDATLAVQADSTGSNARVTLGETPGPIAIRATIGALQANFTVNATLPEPASISTVSGQNQILSAGVLSQPLVVQVTEQNNRPAAGAVVTFSGPPSVRLHPVGSGSPGNPVQIASGGDGRASVRVELLASSALTEQGRPDQLARTITVTASLDSSLSTSFILSVVGRNPMFSADGVVNAASGSGGLVPGGLASIYGTGLVEGIIGTELANGDTSYGGTTVRIGGVPAPLISLTAGETDQINFQVPFETTPGQVATVEVENNGSRAAVSNIPVFPAQPGIFQIGLEDGTMVAAIIHNSTGELVTPDNPAERGELVAMYYTGGGRLNPGIPTGVLGPVPPSIITAESLIGVDNKGAQPIFNGYAPGFLGLYQTNYYIPQDAACGMRPVTMKVGETFAPTTTTAIRCP